MAEYGTKGYDILLPGDMEGPAEDTEKKDKGVIATLNILNKIAYNELIFPQ